MEHIQQPKEKRDAVKREAGEGANLDMGKIRGPGMTTEPCRICGYSATAGNGLCATCDKVRRDIEDDHESRGGDNHERTRQVRW